MLSTENFEEVLNEFFPNADFSPLKNNYDFGYSFNPKIISSDIVLHDKNKGDVLFRFLISKNFADEILKFKSKLIEKNILGVLLLEDENNTLEEFCNFYNITVWTKKTLSSLLLNIENREKIINNIWITKGIDAVLESYFPKDNIKKNVNLKTLNYDIILTDKRGVVCFRKYFSETLHNIQDNIKNFKKDIYCIYDYGVIVSLLDSCTEFEKICTFYNLNFWGKDTFSNIISSESDKNNYFEELWQSKGLDATLEKLFSKDDLKKVIDFKTPTYDIILTHKKGTVCFRKLFKDYDKQFDEKNSDFKYHLLGNFDFGVLFIPIDSEILVESEHLNGISYWTYKTLNKISTECNNEYLIDAIWEISPLKLIENYIFKNKVNLSEVSLKLSINDESLKILKDYFKIEFDNNYRQTLILNKRSYQFIIGKDVDFELAYLFLNIVSSILKSKNILLCLDFSLDENKSKSIYFGEYLYTSRNIISTLISFEKLCKYYSLDDINQIKEMIQNKTKYFTVYKL
jgi:hypothetical protein